MYTLCYTWDEITFADHANGICFKSSLHDQMVCNASDLMTFYTIWMWSDWSYTFRFVENILINEGSLQLFKSSVSLPWEVFWTHHYFVCFREDLPFCSVLQYMRGCFGFWFYFLFFWFRFNWFELNVAVPVSIFASITDEIDLRIEIVRYHDWMYPVLDNGIVVCQHTSDR